MNPQRTTIRRHEHRVGVSVPRIGTVSNRSSLLASLNHPHIAAIYSFEQTSDVHALVLELVEGPTLAERLQRGPLPIAEAVQFALQVAAALEAAHERGIVHRDLKPQNIKVKPDGTVKVLGSALRKLRWLRHTTVVTHEMPLWRWATDAAFWRA